jgi:hypothetical protein
MTISRREFLARASAVSAASAAIQSCSSLLPGGSGVPRGPLEPPPYRYFLNFDPDEIQRIIAKVRAEGDKPGNDSAKDVRLTLRLVEGNGKSAIHSNPGFSWTFNDAFMVWMVTKPVSSGEGRSILRDVLVPVSCVTPRSDSKTTVQACLITGTVISDSPHNLLGYFEDGMAVVQDPASKRAGYIGTGGNLRIETKYQQAFTFSEGTAAVKEKDAEWGVIDTSGNYIIQPKYGSLSRMRDGVMLFSTSKQMGIVNRSGQEIAVPAGGGIEWLNKDHALVKGVRDVWRQRMTWPVLVSTKGKTTTLEGFTNVFEMPNGFAGRKTQDPSFRWYDFDLKPISNQQLDDIAAPFGGAVPVRQGNTWGLLDASSNWRVQPRYTHIGPFSFGLAQFYEANPNGAGIRRAGFLQPDGNEILIPGMVGGDCMGHYLFVVHSDKVPAFYTRSGKLIEPVHTFALPR